MFLNHNFLTNQAMKKSILVLLMVVAGSLTARPAPPLAVGGKAQLTDLQMTDVSGKQVTIVGAAGSNGVLVLFSCNGCPFVLKWEGRYNELKKWADQNKVGMIVLNSNHQNHQGGDSMEEMKKHATEKGYNFSYALDKESKIANAFGGQTTPHAFLLDREMKLVYKGAIDDNYDNAAGVKHAWVKDAIAALGKGQQVKVTETKPVGCGIKRKLD